jgi:hypothetical protein
VKAFFFASLFLLQSAASATTFIYEIEGNTALVCSDDSGQWNCKNVPLEILSDDYIEEYKATVLEDEGCPGC